MALKQRIVASLDIGSNKIVCLIGYINANGKVFIKGFGHQQAKGIYGGKIVNKKEAEKSILSTISIAERMAGKFAAKEAISKAFGTGFSDDIVLNEIEILPDEKGAPKVKIYGKTKKFFEKLKEKNIEISISNTTNYAQSSCIIF